MTWTKIGDEFPDDAADLTDAAVRTHIEAWAWSARRLLDLRIPKRDLRRFAFSADADTAAKELIEAGWWVDDGNTWHLAYRPEWQRTRAQEDHRKAQNAEAQQRKRRHDIGDHSTCLPGRRCHTEPTSAHDTRDDSATPSGSDPGRVGSGRDGTHNPTPQREPTWPLAAIPGGRP